MKTIKVKVYRHGYLSDMTFLLDKIVGVREDFSHNRQAILMTTIGEFLTDTNVNTLNHKIKWAE
jgi:hypothetical protein